MIKKRARSNIFILNIVNIRVSKKNKKNNNNYKKYSINTIEEKWKRFNTFYRQYVLKRQFTHVSIYNSESTHRGYSIYNRYQSKANLERETSH